MPSVLAVVFTAMPAAAFDEAYKLIENAGVWDVEAGPIVYVLDPVGSDDLTSDDSEFDAIRDAFRAWSCVEGVNIGVKEGSGPGPDEINLDDRKNTLFWDETGDDCGMGPGTLGITVGPTSGGIRSSADICFNGRDSTWGIAVDTDVQSIALHEIGHWLGLDHPCDNDQDPATCLPQEEALMFPSWSNVPEREPRSSDVAGVQALYPLAPGGASTCELPYRVGERCGCSGECVDGLVCAPDGAGEQRCTAGCTSAQRDCAAGTVCVLDAPQGDAEAVGLCQRVSTNRPSGAICSLSGQCASGLCETSIPLGATICQQYCETKGDCDDGATCFDNICLGGIDDVECPATEDPGCGCATTTTPTTRWALPLTLAALWGIRRRRRA
jgi:MYXO-CTERM domain-containing protein